MDFLREASAAHKRVWADLFIDVVVTGYYFSQLASLDLVAPNALALASIAFNSVIIALFLAVPLHAYIALQHKQESLDERELLFRTRANQYAFNTLFFLNGALLWLLASYELYPQVLSGATLSPLAIAHLILLSLVIARLVRAFVTLKSYRRGY